MSVETVIVTRHVGALQWLNKHHPEFGEARVITHATPELVRGKRVVGILPVQLAAECAEYWHLEMSVPREKRGAELTAEELERFGCKLTRYEVRKVG